MTIAELPCEGPNPARAKFFAQLASAMEFLAVWNQLDAEAQREAMAYLQSLAQPVYAARIAERSAVEPTRRKRTT